MKEILEYFKFGKSWWVTSQWFSTKGDSVLHKGRMAMSGDIYGYHSGGGSSGRVTTGI